MPDDIMEKSYNHLQAEREWYSRWLENNLFRADNLSPHPPFSLVLPPPNVTGSLHIGHSMTFTIPDVVVRRKKMQGFNVLWLPGLDHAGIATQMVVEKNIKAESKRSKEELGREKFLERVWNWKEKSEKTIIEQLQKLGLALDWSRKRFTLDGDLQRTVQRVFVRLYREGKIYQGIYMVNRCPSCKTVLSDLEVEHKEISGTLFHIKYPIKGQPQRFIVVATTRPETMLGDTAVAVNPKDKRYKKMINQVVLLPLVGREIPIISDEEVEKEFGTGAVKITPAHDPLDFKIAQKHHLEKIVVIDELARMTGPIPEKYLGLDRLACRQAVVADLRSLGLMEKEQDYTYHVGHCHRCSTMVEPNASRQWFLSTKELSLPAIECVEKGEVAFIPDKWKKVYFNWMHQIQDWCISRQLWWGHRIPAYYCQACQEVMVAEEAPPTCTACGSREIKQDEDVLDTWFSSALWPFSTMGWIDNHPDFKVFYPTSLMVTAFDIIFFWVARMIMMGLHFGQDVPFREVLINGLIRDEKGHKMSKTRNNVIDPLDVIREYGADALRFTLAIQAVPGMDISLSISRVKGYRAFANKIWNASRYIIMNLRGDEESEIDFSKTAPTDRWILHLLNQTIEKVNERMDDYRLHEAADILYHFFWDEYCDWYLEFSKNDIENPQTRRVLKLTLLYILQLFHPFMPFITEEIYQKIGGEVRFLLQTSFPQFRAGHVFLEEFTQVEQLKKIVAETRKTRTENHIDPNRRIAVYLKTDSNKQQEFVRSYLKYFDFLVRSARTEIVGEFATGTRGFRGLLPNWEILLPFASDQDRLNELNRLNQELEKLTAHAGQLEQRLSREEFVRKAPAEVVQNMKQTLLDAIDKKNRIQKTIVDLS